VICLHKYEDFHHPCMFRSFTEAVGAMVLRPMDGNESIEQNGPGIEIIRSFGLGPEMN
jgi:hypothetical protein